MSISIGYNQWLSLAKPTLKVPLLVGIVHWWSALVSVGGLLVPTPGLEIGPKLEDQIMKLGGASYRVNTAKVMPN